MKNRRVFGNGVLLLAAMIWGTAFAFQRVGMETIEPITFNAARMALAAAAIGLASFLMKGKTAAALTEYSEAERRQYHRNTVLGGIGCGCCLSIASILQQTGLVYTSAGKAGFITAMYMLLVPVIGFVFLRRKNTGLVWMAVLLGVVGMYFLCMTEEFRLSQGDFYVCLCALFFSFHILCCDHFVQWGNPVQMSAIQFSIATVISAVMAVILEEPTPAKLASALIPIAYCGFVSGGVGYTLQIVGQKHTDPTIASLLMSLESVFAVIAGAILLHEQMSARETAGCLIMFVAIILSQIGAGHQERILDRS